MILDPTIDDVPILRPGSDPDARYFGGWDPAQTMLMQ